MTTSELINVETINPVNKQIKIGTLDSEKSLDKQNKTPIENIEKSSKTFVSDNNERSNAENPRKESPIAKTKLITNKSKDVKKADRSQLPKTGKNTLNTGIIGAISLLASIIFLRKRRSTKHQK
ncbi:LPXTG cell wall anchor domain-containing protein [Staphylococcus simulans]|uniref:LPXTG cell wall anchor domain-containing protein n=1 Tax=Staphylococcus simulans TaxID=1286 RepID=UPI0021D228F3|nr:LPXTG cell wall anchor domain-containing protein [Staphylococcus simulans]UXV37688.1 LPXTG cell wall anchor domain-containing protein [Staphylococcus simulans]UXV40136.1 LPXTG cell wall anchor domain-containing protein [Staphylococcus simulans]